MIRKARNTEEMLNDGLMEYGTVVIQRDALRKETGREFAPQGSLYYKHLEIRERDVNIYEGITLNQTKKVKTYYVPGVDESLKVKLGGVIYDITSTDSDGIYRYWYLSRVKA